MPTVSLGDFLAQIRNKNAKNRKKFKNYAVFVVFIDNHLWINAAFSGKKEGDN